MKVKSLLVSPSFSFLLLFPEQVLKKFFATSAHLYCLIMSFDANRILKESSTLVGLRLLPKASQHPKLQDRATVIPLLRQAGSDTKEAMDQLRPVYQEVELLRQTTFTDKNNNDVTNIPGRLYFIIPSDSHLLLLL